jgi:hypothetical protein
VGPRRDVELHLNRRHTLEGIHDLNAVIVVLKSWTTALNSWTDFIPNFMTEIAPSLRVSADATLLNGRSPPRGVPVQKTGVVYDLSTVRHLY